MPAFQYRARGQRGDAIDGVIEAASTDLAATRLIEGGLTPIDIQPVKEKVGMNSDLAELFPAKVEAIDLIQFGRQMYSLIKAGVPLVSALSGLASNTRNRTLAKTLAAVIESLGAGWELSASLAQHPKIFSVFYVSLVRVGETSGQLEEVFRQLLFRNNGAWRIHFAIDGNKEIYLRGRVEAEHADESTLQFVFGEVYKLVELAFRPLLDAGYR